MEHIRKEKAAHFIRQIYHSLKPGGYAVVQSPNMGYLLASFIRYGDLSHEFGLTERTAVQIFRIGGFEEVSVYPVWNATTIVGKGRELWLRFLHLLISSVEGSNRPRIPTKNLLIIAKRRPE